MSNKLILSRRSLLQSACAGMALATVSSVRALAADSTFAKAKASGSIRVGIANEKPYGYVETDGRLAGAIPDVIRAILEPHGIKDFQSQIVDFSALIPGLNAGRFDVIGAGMYITPARCGAITFSNPLTQTGGGLIVRKNNPVVAKDLAALAANSKLVVGTQTGTAQIDELTKAGLPRDRMVLFARVDEAVAGLQASRCDVLYYPALQVNEVLKLYKEAPIDRVNGFETPLNYQGLGLRKADEDMKAAIDKGLAAMIADGRLLKIIEAYGYGEREIPKVDLTANKICAG